MQVPGITLSGHTFWNLYSLVQVCTLAYFPEFVYKLAHCNAGTSVSGFSFRFTKSGKQFSLDSTQRYKMSCGHLTDLISFILEEELLSWGNKYVIYWITFPTFEVVQFLFLDGVFCERFKIYSFHGFSIRGSNSVCFCFQVLIPEKHETLPGKMNFFSISFYQPLYISDLLSINQ